MHPARLQRPQAQPLVQLSRWHRDGVGEPVCLGGFIVITMAPGRPFGRAPSTRPRSPR